MMEIIGIALVPLLKWILGSIAGKKLSDQEFLDSIKSYQEKKKFIAKSTEDFESEIDKLSKQD